MSSTRRCSRSYCTEPANATLIYIYADSKAVLGPLAVRHEPHDYDLCTHHATTLTVPRGWEVVRQPQLAASPALPRSDDLEALADAVREAARSGAEAAGTVRRGHLRMLR
ncbi:MAG TPA: DUF3499 domain-containing protein [Mycobacteriales bacterium]|nr:DUF3499 domain-containing protein [Mycobacteriales bacterium]